MSKHTIKTAIPEYFNEKVRKIGGIKPGDKITVKTSTNQWKSKCLVIDQNYKDEITFKTKRGKKYMIVTYSSNHPIESSKAMVRTNQSFNSKGVIQELTVYK